MVALLDHLTLRVAGRIHQRRFSGDGHRLRGGADFEAYPQRKHIGDPQHDACAQHGLEAFLLDPDVVRARIQQRLPAPVRTRWY